ncbi:Beta-galactosidase 8, partial [Blyttiomyces sp. JEL0837]
MTPSQSPQPSTTEPKSQTSSVSSASALINEDNFVSKPNGRNLSKNSKNKTNNRSAYSSVQQDDADGEEDALGNEDTNDDDDAEGEGLVGGKRGRSSRGSGGGGKKKRESITTVIPKPDLTKVSYDHRSIIVNGTRTLLFVATIHYPRSTPHLWPKILERAKKSGANAIDTYVFWNLHEKVEGSYDFETGNANLPLFLKMADEAGLYVILRIGPYVCAEWSFGGFPSWVRQRHGMVTRTWNKAFMEVMEGFILKTLQVVKPYLKTNGGPIILLQVENEYGNVEKHYGIEGHKYITWAADLVNSFDVGLPWFMCVQDNVPTLINTANGFYADNWIRQHWNRYYDQPAMFTENWSGWFQMWGQGKPIRPVEDLAFSAARFIARGGTFVAYYMWHGGTNFGRWASSYRTTSYDYDAPLNEYGFENNPKFGELAQLHAVCNEYADVIVGSDPRFINTGVETEAHVYGDLDVDDRALVFLSNYNQHEDATIRFRGEAYKLPHWSVSIYDKNSKGKLRLRYQTSQSRDLANNNVTTANSGSDMDAETIRLRKLAYVRSIPHLTDLVVAVEEGNMIMGNKVSWIQEPIGIWDSESVIFSEYPVDQITVTRDSSDYV